MDKLPRRFIKPESLLIEQTALKLAASFYETGRSQGLTSKYKTHKAYARRHLNEFIPLAVSYLMDIISNPQTSIEMRDMVYDALTERANDVELSNSIPVFNNPFADKFTSDKVVPQKPLVGTSPKSKTLDELPLETMLHQKGSLNG
jgi:hypothetical protein